ncbi:MAG: hypothetical protein SPI30_00655 [Prevotella sp.]|nr:hypothetical protein [Prevotella sp.]
MLLMDNAETFRLLSGTIGLPAIVPAFGTMRTNVRYQPYQCLVHTLPSIGTLIVLRRDGRQYR